MRLTLASVAAAALLAACGGGGGEVASSSSAPLAAAKSSTETAAATTSAAAAQGPLAAAKAGTSRVYLIQMADAPAVAYDGGVQGLAPTKVRGLKKLNPESPEVVAYMAYLKGKQDSLLAKVGGTKVYNYGYTFSGFAASLTQAQADKLAVTKGVLAVTTDEVRKLDTASTPAFLELSGSTGFWNTAGAKGENVVIGIVDSGIWPESLSFSDRVEADGITPAKTGTQVYSDLAGFHGRCARGEEWRGGNCNRKLVSARYYNAGFGGDAAISERWPYEYNSPRDYGGHGTHTASTAGGNANVKVSGPAAAMGRTSGIAPRARISVYKVCWSVEADDGGCATSDSVAAIEQAVADGVDVINYSISGSKTNFRDPVEIAFLYAADAGVFVAASAGNSGPTAATVAHPSPWITTVAAASHNRSSTATATLGNAAAYTGAALNGKLISGKPLIHAVNAGLPGVDATALRLCFSASWNGSAVLDPAKVVGKIVICDRGTSDRIDKSRAVAEAGGLGMILTNTSSNTLNADYHSVPTVHVSHIDGPAIKAYSVTLGAKATLGVSSLQFNTPAPLTASFSSRGPLSAGEGNLLKPDITAPGVDILASVAPPGNLGRKFDLYQGTSMSSPHIAGIAALFKQKFPTWSPMAIKSALMTTAGDTLDSGGPTSANVIFNQGAGHVRPKNALNPGLVFDAGWNDWLGFLCGTQLPASNCTGAGVPVLNPSDYNNPSIAFGALAGTQTVTRKVRNVGGNSATYTPAFTGLTGFTATMNPPTLVIGPGAEATFTVTLTRTSAAIGAYTGGQLTLTDGASHVVRVPIVARPVAFAAPLEASGSYPVTFGFDGAFTATPRGLIESTRANGSVGTDGHVDFPIVIPSGTTYLRVALFDADTGVPSDLDLEIYLGSTYVGGSGGGTSQEEWNTVGPPPVTLTARVVGWSVPTTTTSFVLHYWTLGSTDAGNMTVTAPSPVTMGTTGTITVTPGMLAAGKRWLGSVVYGGASGLPNPTIIRIDTPALPPS
ncbi:S8 family peptidase [Caenimonas sp. SL110]|uniref:S8 family peptidase n=1 Tax=Caenimonas sp. SL110 TaxID=1450524 RepID=UPI0013793769|nr:S8 family peptidase [Caenimonas sp. SL110]